MDLEPTGPAGGAAALTPRAVLDAGGEGWEAMAALIGRRLAELARGAILEIIACERDAYADIKAWCLDAGHQVLRVREDGEALHVWISKGERAE